MVRYMRKCRRISEDTLMEVTQFVGVKTRARTLALAAKRKKAIEETGELEMAYLKLRNRSLVMRQTFSKSVRNSDPEARISRCSSIASCDAVDEKEEVCGDLSSSVCFFKFKGNSENFGDLESTVERELNPKLSTAAQLSMPSSEEIEEFFVKAEKSEKQIFASRYNFDVENEVPLEGRYHWIRIKQ